MTPPPPCTATASSGSSSLNLGMQSESAFHLALEIQFERWVAFSVKGFKGGICEVVPVSEMPFNSSVTLAKQVPNRYH